MIIFYIYDFEDIFDFADDHYSVNLTMFIVALAISVLICGGCCSYCYLQAKRYQKYTLYYEQAKKNQP